MVPTTAVGPSGRDETTESWAALRAYYRGCNIPEGTTPPSTPPNIPRHFCRKMRKQSCTYNGGRVLLVFNPALLIRYLHD